MKLFKTTVFICFICCTFNSINAQEYEQLTEVTITSKLNPEKLMKRAAEHFCRKKAKIFMSEILQYRAVKSNDTYLEFNAFNGVVSYMFYNMDAKQWGGGNKANYFYPTPINILRSNAYGVRGDILKQDSEKNTYRNSPMGSWSGEGIGVKRLAELHSPLNPKMIKFYNYKILEVNESNYEIQWVKIYFKTKKEAYPNKCKLYTEGHLIYNVSKQIITEVYLKNFVECSCKRSYETYNADTDICSTEHNAKISYVAKNGYIIPSEIIMNEKWVSNKTDYCSSLPPRRNPLKYNISEIEVIKFLDFKDCSLFKKETRNNFDRFSGAFDWFYDAPFNKEYWDKVQFKHVNFEKVKRDLNRNEGSLYEQSKINSSKKIDLNNYDDKEHLEYLKQREICRPEAYKIGILFKDYIKSPEKKNIVFNVTN